MGFCLQNTVSLVLHGIDIQKEHKISFRDAMIVAAAMAFNCTAIFSEDLSQDTIIEGVHILKPFSGNSLNSNI